MKKIFVLGASGMLGHKVLEILSTYPDFDVYGTVTNKSSFAGCLPLKFENKIFENIFADKIETIENLVKSEKPDVIINCIGIIKQHKDIGVEESIRINALLPHLLSDLGVKYGFRLINIATDCVFDGQKGNYLESDLPTCHDIYGMTKFLGEVVEKKNILTLRTSIIGHELKYNISLIDWFLIQEGEVKGYKNAIFSGFTTLEFSKLLAEKIIPNDELFGLHQISVDPISKYDLLNIVKNVYKKNLNIVLDEEIKIDRSLNSELFKKEIGYIAPNWDYLVLEMYNQFLVSEFYKQKRENYEKTNKF